jgi:hypothetical protein
MSYYQIPPSFLDFVFTFGKKINARDNHFSGLRDESRMSESSGGYSLPKMFRSGRELRLCYNFRSVEFSPTEMDMPWSIRQCAIYQSLDLETGRLLCVHVKANKVIRDRIQSEVTLQSQSGGGLLCTMFSVFLSTHIIMCDWSSENWRWFINDLEDRLHNVGRGAIAAPVDRLPTPHPSPLEPKSPTLPSSPISRATTFLSLGSPRKQSSLFSPGSLSPIITRAGESQLPLPVQASVHSGKNSMSVDGSRIKGKFITLYNNMRGLATKTMRLDYQPTDEKEEPTTITAGTLMQPPELPPNLSDIDTERPPESLNFSDLQKVQFVEEKTQDVLLHLKLNIDTLDELRQYYQDVVQQDPMNAFPEELKIYCKDNLAKFDKRVLGVIKEIRTLQARTDNLVDMTANRKQLVSFVTDHR